MKTVKKTKIVATLGPATGNPKMIEKLIKAGVNAFRLNFSHGTHESHGQLIGWIKKARVKLDLPVAILQDLSGPKIRIGMITQPPLNIKPGDQLILDTSITSSHGNIVPVSYQKFPDDVQVGHHLLLADGNLEIRVEKIEKPRVYCEVIVGGELTSKKGINYPDGSFSQPAVTAKDREDLLFGLAEGVDCVALSFVKTAADIKVAREIIEAEGRNVKLIAKIEKHEAVKNFIEILENVDGIMVARGDLGVEIPLEKVPFVQKKIIRISKQYGKPVITATQMLLSMVESPRPTRAEAADIANAIVDGTDAIMLSDETAGGKFPLEAVKIMSRIALETESNYSFLDEISSPETNGALTIPQAMSFATTSLSRNLNAAAILCPTTSGFTARMIARFRPRAQIVALTHSAETYYQMALIWGVLPRIFAFERHMDQLLDKAEALAIKEGILEPGDKFVMTGGFPFGMAGATNLIQAGEIEKNDN